MATDLSWESVLAWRVARQQIAQRAPADGWHGVVRRVCGLHAQIASCAELTLWARVDELDRETVRRALWEERSLVRTWAMRGTLHLLPADELGLWVGAQAAITPRYGPATREQFARWFGMPSAAQAGRELKALGDEVQAVTIAGADAGWMLAADVERAAGAVAGGTVALLPGFDQYVVAAPRGAAAVLAEQHAARVYRPQGWLSPVLLCDGRIAGVWHHEHKRGVLHVEIEPFTDPGAAVRAGAEAEAARLAAHLGARELDLSWA